MNTKGYIFLLLFSSCQILLAQELSEAERKGSNTPERAWWDVIHMDLAIEIDTEKKYISGSNTLRIEILDPESENDLQLDLMHPLKIDSIIIDKNLVEFNHKGDHYYVSIDKEKSSTQILKIYYSGFPKTSDQPPYDGGVKWAIDSLGRPFYSVSCQMVGASVWYPCKDYYEDEPDLGATISLTVPDSLSAIANGRLKGITSLRNKKTYSWEVKSPINLYGLTFYIGNYLEIKRNYKGRAGDLEMSYYVLDYNKDKVVPHLFPETEQVIQTLEKWYGPYPFYEDSYKIVEAPYIGMEHQSAIAYGNNFQKGRFGFSLTHELHIATDRLVVHETAHEWYGNNITMADIADRWVQEGFAAYAEELVIEELYGREKGREFFISRRQDYIKNKEPLISPYGIFKDAGSDNYFKSWAIIHMLREVMDDDIKFREMLNAMNTHFKHETVWSRELEEFINDYYTIDLAPFFDQYLRKADLPILEIKKKRNKWNYRWTNCSANFELPVKIIAESSMQLFADSRWRKVKIHNSNKTLEILPDPNYLFTLNHIE